jgi:hypothetical protein
MGKINLNSINSCLVNAKQSFEKQQVTPAKEVQLVDLGNARHMDSLRSQTDEFLKNLPVFSQTA